MMPFRKVTSVTSNADRMLGVKMTLIMTQNTAVYNKHDNIEQRQRGINMSQVTMATAHAKESYIATLYPFLSDISPYPLSFTC